MALLSLKLELNFISFWHWCVHIRAHFGHSLGFQISSWGLWIFLLPLYSDHCRCSLLNANSLGCCWSYISNLNSGGYSFRRPNLALIWNSQITSPLLNMVHFLRATSQLNKIQTLNSFCLLFSTFSVSYFPQILGLH